MSSRRVALEVSAGCAPYRALLRKRGLTWGATEAEARSRLPGDELVDDAAGVVNRPIPVHAPGSAVWPWLAQMRPAPRGGAYTYDWIENLLGLNTRSVDRVDGSDGACVPCDGAQDAWRDQAAGREACRRARRAAQPRRRASSGVSNRPEDLDAAEPAGGDGRDAPPPARSHEHVGLRDALAER
jgi:hypothetical protein